MSDESVSKPITALKTLAESKALDGAVSKVTIFRIRADEIEVEPGFNRPIERAHVDQFKKAIKEGAVIPPIQVRVDDSRIILVDGHHRHIAITELIAEGNPITGMDAIQFRGNDADRVIHLLTSAQGLALTPLDAGLQYQKLQRFGLTTAQIAARIGKSVSHVDNCLVLARGDSDVHAHIRANEVSSTTATQIVREHGTQAGQVIRQRLAESPKGRVTTQPKPPRVPRPCDKCDLVQYRLTKLADKYAPVTGEAIQEMLVSIRELIKEIA